MPRDSHFQGPTVCFLLSSYVRFLLLSLSKFKIRAALPAIEFSRAGCFSFGFCGAPGAVSFAGTTRGEAGSAGSIRGAMLLVALITEK